MTDPTAYTVDEAAIALHRSRPRIYQLIAEGKLKVRPADPTVCGKLPLLVTARSMEKLAKEKA
jgi:hypothetical protein